MPQRRKLHWSRTLVRGFCKEISHTVCNSSISLMFLEQEMSNCRPPCASVHDARGTVEYPVTQQNSETLHLGQSCATGVLGKLVVHCELCFYHLPSVKDVLGGLLFSASRSTAERYFNEMMLLLTQETFSVVNCKSSIQKIRLSFFPKIIGSHYSWHLLWKLNTLLKAKAKPFEKRTKSFLFFLTAKFFQCFSFTPLLKFRIKTKF